MIGLLESVTIINTVQYRAKTLQELCNHLASTCGAFAGWNAQSQTAKHGKSSFTIFMQQVNAQVCLFGLKGPTNISELVEDLSTRPAIFHVRTDAM